MERWSTILGKHVENKKIDAFLEDIAAVYEKHNLVLLNKDIEGEFIVGDATPSGIDTAKEWLFAAHDCTEHNNL